jgi:hypothetical protein
VHVVSQSAADAAIAPAITQAAAAKSSKTATAETPAATPAIPAIPATAEPPAATPATPGQSSAACCRGADLLPVHQLSQHEYGCCVFQRNF